MTVQIICLLNFVIRNQLTMQFEISDNKFESKGIAHHHHWIIIVLFILCIVSNRWPLATRTYSHKTIESRCESYYLWLDWWDTNFHIFHDTFKGLVFCLSYLIEFRKRRKTKGAFFQYRNLLPPSESFGEIQEGNKSADSEKQIPTHTEGRNAQYNTPYGTYGC